MANFFDPKADQQFRLNIGVPLDADWSILVWRKGLPSDGRYLLIRFYDAGEMTCTLASYEGGVFHLFSPDADRTLRPGEVLGWTYLPYDL